jgi:hypothetical protein
MYKISHRGNINGPEPDRENSPDYIQEALNSGYYVEIDVRVMGDKIFLGHDEPQYEVSLEFLKNEKFFCHAKNLSALCLMTKEGIHCFSHDKDDYILTSKGLIWAFPGKPVNETVIAVMPEIGDTDISSCLGVCSDYIGKYSSFKLKKLLETKIPTVLVRLGDGEYNASLGHWGQNCDGTQYTPTLKNRLNSSVQYLTKIPNCIIGQWNDTKVQQHWESISGTTNINWGDYHTFQLERGEMKSSDIKQKLWKVIKDSKLKKILVSNKLLVKATVLLDINIHIHIDTSNWFDNNYDEIYSTLLNEMKDEDCIVLFAAGMGGKCMIADVHKVFPYSTYLDIGSSLDFISTKKDTRGWKYSYEETLDYFKPLIQSVESWEDPKYNSLYQEASQSLGRHLN